MKETL